MHCLQHHTRIHCDPRLLTASTRPSMQQRARRSTVPRASPSAETATQTAPGKATVDVQERMAFLLEDLPHLFDSQGIDESQYDDVVTFLDPITKYSSAQGYMFNIRMLKTVFSPRFELHDIQQTGPLEATSRWTMTMDFTPARLLRLTKFWQPTIIFTGTSIYGFNPANGKIDRHVDTWDSIQNQDFFSFEAFGDFFKQLLSFYTTPSIETPEYTVLRRTAKYQVRRYEPFLVAEAPLDDALASSSTSSDNTRGVDPAGAGRKAFGALAAYIFGKGNAAGEAMKMTTPVFSTTDGRMQFVIGQSAHKSVDTLPAPSVPGVSCKQEPGGVYAVRIFNGVASSSTCTSQAAELRTALLRDGLQPAENGYSLARYNDPSVKPPFRRNEVLIKLQDFDLWHEPGRSQ